MSSWPAYTIGDGGDKWRGVRRAKRPAGARWPLGLCSQARYMKGAPTMRYGVTLPNIGVEATELVELAVEAEAAGWDGVFVWDCVFIADERPGKMATCDPWIALAAMAARTQRVKLGTMVTPLSRRRPWKVARETVTLDRLS